MNITLGVAGSGGMAADTMLLRWEAAIGGSGSSPFFEANMDSNWTFESVKCVKALAGGALDVAEHPIGNVGSATLATPAMNTSVLVHKVTGIGGRRYRGRMSVPPCNIGEGSISRAGIIDSTALGVQNDYWNYVWSFLSSGGVNPYLLHYPTTLPDGGDFPPAPTAISSFSVSPLVGTNGSRLR